MSRSYRFDPRFWVYGIFAYGPFHSLDIANRVARRLSKTRVPVRVSAS